MRADPFPPLGGHWTGNKVLLRPEEAASVCRALCGVFGDICICLRLGKRPLKALQAPESQKIVRCLPPPPGAGGSVSRATGAERGLPNPSGSKIGCPRSRPTFKQLPLTMQF
ncbi:hypothetical protein NN561_015866 [Cricetulus griseus]